MNQKVLDAINLIERAWDGDKTVLREKWLQYLFLTREEIINPENYLSIAGNRHTLQYVYRTICALRDISSITDENAEIILEVLKWSEVSKCGLPHQRAKWNSLLDHAISSAEIYKESVSEEGFNPQVYELIKVHGDIGQYCKGELLNRPKTDELSFCLAECVIKGVSVEIWDNLLIPEVLSAEERIAKFCKVSSIDNLSNESRELVNRCDFWYSVAFFPMGVDRVKSFLDFIASECPKNINTIDFQPLMDKIYYYHNGNKMVDYCILAMIEENSELHSRIKIDFFENRAQISLKLSEIGIGIDNFYRSVNHSDLHHKNAVLKMLDHFGYRSDSFDRLGNEDDYLKHMNDAAADKAKLVDFIDKDDYVLDVGPGGGIMMEMYSGKTSHVYGIDISEEVCKRLRASARMKGLNWELIQGDFFTFESDIKFDKIIFCSCIHELFSFCEYEGRKYNKNIIKAIIDKAKSILNPGGKIIIRDGIAAENNRPVTLKFTDVEFETLFEDYLKNFDAFELNATKIGEHCYSMPYNSMMESLYTINWGAESLPYEIKEWYGYYTKADWLALGATGVVSYLQREYEYNILPKVTIKDETGEINLPDSNCIVVIEQ